MREVIVGFFGFRSASPFVWLPFTLGFVEGGRAKWLSGWECNEDAVEAEGTGEATGFEGGFCGLLLAGAAMVVEVVIMRAVKVSNTGSSESGKRVLSETQVSRGLRGLGHSPDFVIVEIAKRRRFSGGS